MRIHTPRHICIDMCAKYVINNIHEKITLFRLAEKSAVFPQHSAEKRSLNAKKVIKQAF